MINVPSQLNYYSLSIYNPIQSLNFSRSLIVESRARGNIPTMIYES